jgi:hypothetical protein
MEGNINEKSGRFLPIMLIVFFAACAFASLWLGDVGRVRELSLGQEQGFRVAMYALAFCLYATGSKKLRIFAYVAVVVYIGCTLFFELTYGYTVGMLIRNVVTAALFFVACSLIDKVGLGKLTDRVPTLAIAVYFALSVCFDFGFSSGKLLQALLQGVCFYGLTWLLRRISFGRQFPMSRKARNWFTAIGVVLCLALIVYAINTFAFLGYIVDYSPDDRIAMGQEFGAGAVYIYLAFAAAGYMLLLCRQETGGLMALLFSATLFLMLFFTFLAPITNGAEGMYPFFSRLTCGLKRQAAGRRRISDIRIAFSTA